MSKPSKTSVPAVPAAQVWLQRIGTVGAGLTLTILGASILLRLTTVFAVDGHTLSTLPPDVEVAIRLLHRLSASGVAMLALCAMILCWTERRSASHLAMPTAWIVAATFILALIGPLTPGYRLAVITIVNVSGGMVLLMAFWWLRESVASEAATRQPVAAISWAAIIVFIAHVATGAAASVWQMRGVRWPVFVHLGSLVLAVILIEALVLEFHRAHLRERLFARVAPVLGLQLLLGYVLAWQETRPVWLSFPHALLSPVLALALVSLVLRGATRVKA